MPLQLRGSDRSVSEWCVDRGWSTGLNGKGIRRMAVYSFVQSRLGFLWLGDFIDGFSIRQSPRELRWGGGPSDFLIVDPEVEGT